jgi:hypothetical protein
MAVKEPRTGTGLDALLVLKCRSFAWSSTDPANTTALVDYKRLLVFVAADRKSTRNSNPLRVGAANIELNNGLRQPDSKQPGKTKQSKRPSSSNGLNSCWIAGCSYQNRRDVAGQTRLEASSSNQKKPGNNITSTCLPMRWD